MAYTVKELREMQDDVLVRLHDEMAVHTFVGVQYYLDELRRRETLASMKASENLSRRALWLTIANALLAAAAVLIALFK